jgi:hypothetical protein
LGGLRSSTGSRWNPSRTCSPLGSNPRSSIHADFPAWIFSISFQGRFSTLPPRPAMLCRMAVRCVSNERQEHNAGFDFLANQKIIPHPSPSSEIKTRIRPASRNPRAVEVRCRAVALGWLHSVPQAPSAAEPSSGFAVGHDPPPPSTTLRQPATRGGGDGRGSACDASQRSPFSPITPPRSAFR